MLHDPLKLTAGPKVCIRTCDRPVLLDRLLRSIMWEPWMRKLEIEVSDGSHTAEGQRETKHACATRGATYVNAMELPHAAFYWQTYRGCKLGGGYNLWQIMERHRGREIILLDDDWVFPLSRSIGGTATIGSMVADRYIFSSEVHGRPDSVNNLPDVIQQAKDSGCNTVQVCTTGHGVCNDYSWVPEMQRLGLVGGDPRASEFIRYKLNHPRILLSGFMTPIWIGCVPHVKPLPPNSADDDTIMLQHNDFGRCLWSDSVIAHLRDKPKDFTRRVVTDYEIIYMVMQWFNEHQSVSSRSVELCTQVIADAKRAHSDYYRSDELCTYINLFLKSSSPPQFGAQ